MLDANYPFEETFAISICKYWNQLLIANSAGTREFKAEKIF